MSSSSKVAVLMAALALGTSVANAQALYGNLANFDVVNQTGYEAHGFEIQILDSSISSAGLDIWGSAARGLGESRYQVTATDITGADNTHLGITITYSAAFSNGVWSATTANAFGAGVASPTGETCFGAGQSANCDHFGVATTGLGLNNVSYNWLVDSGTGGAGSLTKVSVGIPTISFADGAAGVEARLDLQNGATPFQAYWVSVSKDAAPGTAVDLSALSRNKGGILNDKNNIQSDNYQLWQPGTALGAVTFNDIALGKTESAMLRYDFYRYLGGFELVNGQFTASCDNVTQAKCKGLGDWVGSQMVGYNGVAGAVPEPNTYAMLLAGLGVMGMLTRRRLPRAAA